MLGVSLNYGGGGERSQLMEAIGWNHFDTRNKVTVCAAMCDLNYQQTHRFLVFFPPKLHF